MASNVDPEMYTAVMAFFTVAILKWLTTEHFEWYPIRFQNHKKSDNGDDVEVRIDMPMLTKFLHGLSYAATIFRSEKVKAWVERNKGYTVTRKDLIDLHYIPKYLLLAFLGIVGVVVTGVLYGQLLQAPNTQTPPAGCYVKTVGSYLPMAGISTLMFVYGFLAFLQLLGCVVVYHMLLRPELEWFSTMGLYVVGPVMFLLVTIFNTVWTVGDGAFNTPYNFSLWYCAFGFGAYVLLCIVIPYSAFSDPLETNNEKSNKDASSRQSINPMTNDEEENKPILGQKTKDNSAKAMSEKNNYFCMKLNKYVVTSFVCMDMFAKILYFSDTPRVFTYLIVCYIIPFIFSNRKTEKFTYFFAICTSIFWMTFSMFYVMIPGNVSPSTQFFVANTDGWLYYLSTWCQPASFDTNERTSVLGTLSAISVISSLAYFVDTYWFKGK